MKVNLCCGKLIRKGWLNVDLLDFGQEVIADLNKPWMFLNNESTDYIYCKDGLEHVDSVGHFLLECARVLKRGGIAEVVVPHFKNPSAYRLTHRHYFSWSYFNSFPEPHDPVQNLKVISNKLILGDKLPWALVNYIMNIFPKYWERLLYASNVGVKLLKL